MRNPFTALRTAVSRLFTPKPTPAPVVEYKAPDQPKVQWFTMPASLIEGGRFEEPGYIATQAARNARRKERQSTRAFVRTLNQGRG